MDLLFSLLVLLVRNLNFTKFYALSVLSIISFFLFLFIVISPFFALKWWLCPCFSVFQHWVSIANWLSWFLFSLSISSPFSVWLSRSYVPFSAIYFIFHSLAFAFVHSFHTCIFCLFVVHNFSWNLANFIFSQC